MNIRQPYLNLLRAALIVGGGFILFNAAFLIAAFVINTTRSVVGRSGSILLLLLVIFLIFAGVALSRADDTIKATFLTMPLMTVLVLLGAQLSNQPSWMAIGISALVLAGTGVYVYLKKLTWPYYFAIIYVAVIGLCIVLFGIEI